MNNLKSDLQKILLDIKNNVHRNVKTEFFIRTKFKDLYDNIMSFTKFLDDRYGEHIQFRSRIACILNDIRCISKCQNDSCSNEVDLTKARPDQAFPRYCCRKCSETDSKRLEKTRKTKTEKYGDPNYCNEKKAKDTILKKIEEDTNYWKDIDSRRRETKLKRYGSETYVNIEKAKQTKSQKYGDQNYNNREKAKNTNSLKTDDELNFIIQKRLATFKTHIAQDHDFLNAIDKKRKTTSMNRYGDENFTNNEKRKATVMERYGVECVFQDKDIQTKIKQTNLDKYGVEFYSSSDECRTKVQNTCKTKYGYSASTACPEIREKMRQTNLKKYGFEYAWQAQPIKEKIKATNLMKYGYESAIKNQSVKLRASDKYTMIYVNLYGTITYHTICEYKRFQADTHTDAKCMQLRFDSAPELAMYVWLTDNNIEFEYQPKTDVELTYEYFRNNQKYTASYMPDFRIGEQYFEIKGDQFFKDDGTMYCPYRNSKWTDFRYAEECDKYERKHQCMLKNNVTILRESDYNKYIDYVNDKYGKDFLKKFKKTRKDSSK